MSRIKSKYYTHRDHLEGLTKSENKMREKVEKKVNSEPKSYWFRICDDKSIAIVKGETEEETKKDLKKLINKDPNKYEDAQIWRVTVKYHKKVHSGRVSIAINNWSVIDGKLKRKPLPGKVGIVWVDDQDLELSGWSKKYISRVIKGLSIHGLKLKSVMPNPYFKFENF